MHNCRQDKMRTLSGLSLDAIEAAEGSLVRIIDELEVALRTLDDQGTFKPAELTQAFLRLDKNSGWRFSQAAGQTPDDWAKAAKDEMRTRLALTNKKQNSQQWRDARVTQGLPTKGESSTSKVVKKTKPIAPQRIQPKQAHSQSSSRHAVAARTEEDATSAECVVPGYSGETKACWCSW